jgi:hypothetical protein
VSFLPDSRLVEQATLTSQFVNLGFLSPEMVSCAQATQGCPKQKLFRNITRRVAPRNEETLNGEKEEALFN